MAIERKVISIFKLKIQFIHKVRNVRIPIIVRATSHPKSFVALLLFLIVLFYNRNGFYLTEYSNLPDLEATTDRWYAIFACSSPNDASRRGLDYVFHLPLTALAWERIGFKCIIPIIGNQTEWRSSPLLSLVLTQLEARKAEILFVEAPKHLHRILSQTARVFAVNVDRFPAKSDDYVITSDADLWPLNRDHFTPKKGKKLILVHSQCCGFFQINGTVYPMYAMSNIGATVATWQQILNEGHRFANDSSSIMQYLEDVHGPRVRDGVMAGNWYVDQETVSLRIHQWIDKYSNESVYYVSDQGFDRVDRFRWTTDLNQSAHNQTHFRHMFDAHLPGKSRWNDIQPLLQLMFGLESWQLQWAHDYVDNFNRISETLPNL